MALRENAYTKEELDAMAAIISYRDLTKIFVYLPEEMQDKISSRVERWGSMVEDFL